MITTSMEPVKLSRGRCAHEQSDVDKLNSILVGGRACGRFRTGSPGTGYTVQRSGVWGEEG